MMRSPEAARSDARLAINQGTSVPMAPRPPDPLPDWAMERAHAILTANGGFEWYGGEATTTFEREFADALGGGYAVLCSSGTAALHVALHCAGVGPGTVVALPSFAFYPCVTTVLQLGARPLLLPVDPRTLVVDAPAIVDLLPRGCVFLAVHALGRAVDVRWLMGRRPDVMVIEDAAEAQLVTLRGELLGADGQAGIWSLTSTQNEVHGAGVAGVVMTRSEALATSIRRAIHYGKDDVRHTPGAGVNPRAAAFGFNYQTSEIEALVALARLRCASERWAARRRVGAQLERGLRRIGLDVLDSPPACETNYFDVVARIPDEWVPHRDWLLAAMLAEGCDGAWTYYSLCGLDWLADIYRRRGWWTDAEAAAWEEQRLVGDSIIGFRPLMAGDAIEAVIGGARRVLFGE